MGHDSISDKIMDATLTPYERCEAAWAAYDNADERWQAVELIVASCIMADDDRVHRAEFGGFSYVIVAHNERYANLPTAWRQKAVYWHGGKQDHDLLAAEYMWSDIRREYGKGSLGRFLRWYAESVAGGTYEI